MYNGCHSDIRLSIDYTNIQILHVVKHTAVVTTYRYRSIGILTFWRQIPTVVCIGVLYLSENGWYVCSRVGAQSTVPYTVPFTHRIEKLLPYTVPFAYRNVGIP